LKRTALAILFFFLSGAAAEEEALPPEWRWGGDMRLRAQAEKNGDNDERWIERLRLRYGVNAIVNPELRVEVRLATATANRSANQNLGDSGDGGMPRRIFGLDLGYIEYKPVFFAKLYGGRIPQLHYRPGLSQVILDENISLEGAGAVLDYSWDENWRAVLAGGSVIVRDNYDTYYSTENTDSSINWMQARLEMKFGRWKTVAGGGFYNFTSLKGRMFSDIVKGATANGNTEYPPGTIKYAFLPREYFLETAIPVGTVNLTLFGERIINGEAPSDVNGAWWIGFMAGQKDWDFELAYAEIKPDAVFALFTYADFTNGTTDSRGWWAAARWGFAKNMSFKVIEFIERSQASTLNKEYNRTNLDLSMSF
jgi:hypothetical protein